MSVDAESLLRKLPGESWSPGQAGSWGRSLPLRPELARSKWGSAVGVPGSSKGPNEAEQKALRPQAGLPLAGWLVDPVRRLKKWVSGKGRGPTLGAEPGSCPSLLASALPGAGLEEQSPWRQVFGLAFQAPEALKSELALPGPSPLNTSRPLPTTQWGRDP